MVCQIESNQRIPRIESVTWNWKEVYFNFITVFLWHQELELESLRRQEICTCTWIIRTSYTYLYTVYVFLLIVYMLFALYTAKKTYVTIL